MEDLIMKIIDIEDRKSLRTLRKPTESLKSELRTNLVKCVMTLREEWRLKTSL